MDLNKLLQAMKQSHGNFNATHELPQISGNDREEVVDLFNELGITHTWDTGTRYGGEAEAIKIMENYITTQDTNESSALEECLDFIDDVACSGHFTEQSMDLLRKYRPKKPVDHGFTGEQIDAIFTAVRSGGTSEEQDCYIFDKLGISS